VPTLLIRGPDGTLVERELEGRLTVGADDDNDLVWRNDGIEKRHANFFADGGEVVLEQLGGTSGKTKLKPGVRVLIGGYEVSVKPGEQQLSVRKLPAASDTLTDEGSNGAAFPFKLVFTLFGIALAALLGLGAWNRLHSVEPPREPATAPVAAVEKPNAECPNLEDDLKMARDGATQRALDAAERVLACDPLNAEGTSLKRSLRKELDGQALLTRAKEFIDLERDEQALEQLEKIPADTDVFRSALPLLHEVGGRVQHKAQADCDEYTKAGKKALAQPRCDEAARLTKVLAPPKTQQAKGPTLAERVLARTHEPVLAEPLLLYAAGRTAEAMTKLQALRERNDKAALHATADALRKDISNADALYKVGSRALEKGDLERGAAAFHDALALDAKLLPEGDSTLKKNMEHDLAAKAYELGVVQAQRQNWPKACAAWKVGFSFSHVNTELNTSITSDCTNRARPLLDSTSCKDLDDALALAVPGDDLEPRLKQRRTELGCRP
jgi:tetratricopeptide (TPR) repeat protein